MSCDLLDILSQFLRIILSPRYWEYSPIKLGTNFFHIGADIRFQKKTQSENHCKYFNSVLRTLTKFVLFTFVMDAVA
jgi:hypothetical protein